MVVCSSVNTDLRTQANLKGSTRMRTILGSLALVLILAATSFAQPKKGGDAAGKVKVYDFSGDTIEGDLVRPEGTGVDAIGVTNFSSLIRIRKEFIAEIIKAAEDL